MSAAMAADPSARPGELARPAAGVSGLGSGLAAGALQMVLAALCFAAMSGAVKAASATLPSSMVVFFRNAVSLALLLPWAWSVGRQGLATRRLGEHLIRGLFGLAAMACFFWSVGHIRLAEAVLLNYTIPLFLPLIERLWLKQRISGRLLPALAVGFAGILLILKPGSGLFQPVAMAALGAGVMAAVAQVGIRRLTASEPVTKIVFYFAAIATAVSALPLPWTWTPPSPAAWAALLASGLLATAGQLLLTRAYAAAPASYVGPFLYTSVVFSGLIDWLVWGTTVDGLFITGAALVVAAGMLTLRIRERPSSS
jgi:drug/metabolite transporter (DMT)-like permease